MPNLRPFSQSFILFFLFFFPGHGTAFAQEALLDSLQRQYASAADDSVKIHYGERYVDELIDDDPLATVELAYEVFELIDSARARNSCSEEFLLERYLRVLNDLATSYSYLGDEQQCIRTLLRMLEIAEANDIEAWMRTAMANIGVEYQHQGMIDEAITYYRKALVLARTSGSVYGTAMAYGNIGTAIGQVEPDSTIYYYRRSLQTMRLEGMRDRAGAMGWMLHNMGAYHLNLGRQDSALHYYQRSLDMRASIDHRVGLCLIHRALGSLYFQMGDTEKALEHVEESVRIAEESQLNQFSPAAYKLRSEISEEMGAYHWALKDYKQFVLLSDSIKSERKTKDLVQQSMRYEYEKKLTADSLAQAEQSRLIEERHQEEMRAKERSRNISMLGGGLLVLLAGGLYSRLRYVRRTKKLIEEEKERSEQLLLNILPSEIAEELKIKGKAEARDFEEVSILFTDFKDFTERSSQLSASALVDEVNHCFEAFDGIMEKHGIEKIKTIGDSYMAAAGVPVPYPDSTSEAVLAALEMQGFIAERAEQRRRNGEAFFEMRVGIHTGPVVAGIVGVKKFQYDIWGDTVNTASRMETNGEVAKVNISHQCYLRIKDDPRFTFEERSELEIKGKGMMKMWFVELS
jgi:class 3 adenylate cyclase/Tfp pilus assembly protein PilF